MRDYALNRAIANGDAGRSLFSRLLHNWRARRDVAKLEDFDDFMLADIGLTRADVHWAEELPLTTDPAAALEERAFRRNHFEPERKAGWGAY